MEQYASTEGITLQLFTYHVSMIGWGIAIILMILLLTCLWKYTWKIAFVINAIGWLCFMYAGLTGEWFIGWFGWTPFLSCFLFMRFLTAYAPSNVEEPNLGEEPT